MHLERGLSPAFVLNQCLAAQPRTYWFSHEV